MKYIKEMSPYNEKRYSKPWIAKINFSSNPKGDFKFGDFVGAAGEAGMLVIELEAGDYFAWGQKDNRNPKYTEVNFCMMEENGDIKSFSTKAQAYKHFLTKE